MILVSFPILFYHLNNSHDIDVWVFFLLNLTQIFLIFFLKLISLFNRNQFKPQPQLLSHPFSDITRDNLLDQSFSDPNSPWYIPRGTDTFLDSDRLYAKFLIKDLVSLIPQDVPFNQIQAPSGLAFNPTSPTIQP